MSTRFRGLPPRVLLKLRDNRGSRIPTISRTVTTSDRTDTDATPYDDTKTLIFSGGVTQVTGQEIPVAESLYIWRELIVNDRHDALFDLAEATGSIYPQQAKFINYRSPTVVKGIADHFLEQPDTTAPYRPFNETRLYEQDIASDFYASGTSQAELGEGFTSRLRDKTIMRLQFGNSTKYQLPSTTASLAYYDVVQDGFVQVGDTTNPQDAWTQTDIFTNRLIPEPADPDGPQLGLNFNVAFDGRLFGPLGNKITSGTVGVGAGQTYNAPIPLLNQFYDLSISEVQTYINPGTATINPIFAANRNNSFTVDNIRHPFLLEKVVIDIPLSASNGWLNDTTTVINYPSVYDIGGPCITVSLLSQHAPDNRDIICSGTIIPIGDNFAQLYTPPLFSAGTASLAAHGFRAFTKPTAIVSGTGGSFVGRVRLELEASTSNNFYAVADRTLVQSISTIADARVLGVGCLGRSMRRVPSGKSYFGKDFTQRNRTDFPAPYKAENALGVNRDETYFVEESVPSPYVILPNDRLILAVSKFRPVTADPALNPDGGNRTLMTASHDVAIDTGQINITLYGSVVRERREFHFGRNEPLTTNAATEALSFINTVVDQFDVSHRSAFSGTYVDNFMSGIMEPSSDNSGPEPGSDFRQVRGSSVAGETSYPMNRFVKMTSFSELYFDSFGPDPRDVQIIDGADVAVFNTDDNDRILMYPLRHNAGIQTIDRGATGTSLTENNKWPFAFPFEPRYGGLQRLSFIPSKEGQSTKRYVYGNAFADLIQDAVITRPSDAIVRARSDHSPLLPPVGIGTSSIEHLQNTQPNAPGAFYGRRLDTGIFNQGFYSFGDEIANQPKYGDRATTTLPIDLGPGVVKYQHTFHRGKVHIRGWKYGLYDGNPRATSLIMRRDRFGQFRDMLEQRPFTRFVVRGARRTLGPIRVRFTSAEPSDTESSNLSTAATSSLPYFDGEARNRDELPSSEIVQVSIPTLTSLTP